MNPLPRGAREPDTRIGWPFLRLAAQNLLRRPVRVAALAAVVAVGVGTGFAAVVGWRAVDDTAAVGFGRTGADLLVVPKDALVHLTPALLAVEPNPHTLTPEAAQTVAAAPGVAVAAPQAAVRLPVLAGGHTHDHDLVAFDPARDFTVLPWVKEKLPRPFGAGDVIVGARRPEQVGSEITIGGRTLTVFARLGLTGVGAADRSFFASFETAATIPGVAADPDRPTGLLVRLADDARPEQVRFALAGVPELKVTGGTPMLTTVRRTLTAVFAGVLLVTGLVLGAAVLQVGVVYAAVLAERRQELGLLLTIGAGRGQVARMVLVEAAVTTLLGGAGGLLLGAALLAGLRRTLGYHLESLDVSLVWPPAGWIAAVAAIALAVAAAVGPVGAVVPAWRACRRDPYDLARGEAA